MFSRFLFVFILLFHSPLVFSLEAQVSPLRTCIRAFYSLLNIRQNDKKPVDSVTTVNDVVTESVAAEPQKKREAVEHEPQNPIDNDRKKAEWERAFRLDMVLEEWSSGQVQNRLSEGELKVPQRTREEETLKEQGFHSEYIRGINEMNEMIAVAQRLRQLEVDPYTTSIDYFASKIEEHLRFMEEGAIDPWQKRRLELLRKYGEKAVEEKSVTYEKWIKFNEMLAEALSDGSIGVGKSIENIIKQFPKVILLPTTEGMVGFITISEGIKADVYVLGLSNREENKYDGIFGDPLGLFNHDLFHVNRILDAKNRTNYSFYRRMEKVREEIKNLPPEKRKPLEFIYWFLVHEKPESLPSYPLMIKTHLMKQIPYLYQRDGREGIEEVPKMVDDFMEVYNSI